VSLANHPLPADPSALRVFAADLQAELARKNIELAANAAEIHAKALHIEKLKMQLAVLRRARFGRSSEKLDREIEQLELLIGELEEDVAAQDARANDAAAKADPSSPVKTRPRKQPVRKPLPEHLPREIVTHEPPCSCPGCGTLLRLSLQSSRRPTIAVPHNDALKRTKRPRGATMARQVAPRAPSRTGRFAA